MLTDTLAARYRQACQTRSDIHLHLPGFVEHVEQVARRRKPRVIELGTRSGVSTVAWLYALGLHDGRLTTVDLDPAPDLGVFDYWTHVQGDDCDPDVLVQLEPADIVFIDTSHEFNHTLRELHLYRWLVEPGGVILLHDTMLEHPPDVPLKPRWPVRRAIEAFCDSEGLAWSNNPACWGLGTIRM